VCAEGRFAGGGEKLWYLGRLGRRAWLCGTMKAGSQRVSRELGP
jgi:hypothetical protein